MLWPCQLLERMENRMLALCLLFIVYSLLNYTSKFTCMLLLRVLIGCIVCFFV